MRKQYFVDTGFRIALAAPRDQLHGQALSVARRVRDDEASLLTTRAVLLELGSALSGLRHRVVAVEVPRAVEADPAIEIVSWSDALYSDALEMFAQHQDKECSLTDLPVHCCHARRGLVRGVVG